MNKGKCGNKTALRTKSATRGGLIPAYHCNISVDYSGKIPRISLCLVHRKKYLNFGDLDVSWELYSKNGQTVCGKIEMNALLHVDYRTLLGEEKSSIFSIPPGKLYSEVII